MSNTIKLVIAQINFQLGDIEYNAEQVIQLSKQARDELQADLILFPELTLTGYPPEDLLYRMELYQRVEKALAKIAAKVKNIAVVVGHPHKVEQNLYNAASWIEGGKIQATYHKQHLPNYEVFDEKRYFNSGHDSCVVNYKGINFALVICEDLWHKGPMQQAANNNADIVLSLNASPYHMLKPRVRVEKLKQRIAEAPMPIVYAHWVAGQDELVFDGGSFAIDAQGKLCAQAPFYQPALLPIELSKVNNKLQISSPTIAAMPEDNAAIYQSLLLGTKDYVSKNHFAGALIGLSGGIDSALTLAIACDALGAKNVEAVLMPSRYTAEMSNSDALAQVKALGCEHRIISIEPIFESLMHSLSDNPEQSLNDLTLQNLQARARGVILMALSNQSGKIVLTTSNKSEVAVGYSTLYGDMVGGFAPIKDVVKTLVYQLARHRNSITPVIPERIISRAPSAELAHNQVDQDTLPDYAELDNIIKQYIELDRSKEDLIADGFDKNTVEKTIQMIDRSEYKRKQAPIGIKITPRAFGRDRRYPITQQFNKN